MPTYLLTGAMSGWGLEVALRLAGRGGVRLILAGEGSGQAESVIDGLRHAGAVDARVLPMDLASLRSVADGVRVFRDTFDGRLDGVLLNADVRSTRRLAFSEDGYELTFAVNHLAQLLLLEGVIDRLSERAVVGWTSSAVHDSTDIRARLAGFRGARYTDAVRVAKGDFGSGVSAAQACRDAYATSAFCAIVTARWFAEWHSRRARFFAFGRRSVAGLRGVSREREVLAGLLVGAGPERPDDAYVGAAGVSLDPAPLALERWVGDDLMAFSDSVLAAFRVGPAMVG